jgi:hypothetical protein
MIRLEFTVENTADLLETPFYGAGALGRWESSASRTGTYVEGGTFALISGVDVYVVPDSAGIPGETWYRERVSNAAGSSFGVYSAPRLGGVMSLTSIAEVRALVKSRLTDVDLQTIIDREEAWLAGKIGQLSGERTDTFTPGTTNTPLYLSRRTESVAVTDNGVAVTELLFTPSTGCLRRVVGVYPWPYPQSETWYPSWQGVVTVTWTPSDGAAITAGVINLIRGTIGETGFDSEQIADYSYTRGASAGRVSRVGVVRSILLRRPAYSLSLRSTAEARP